MLQLPVREKLNIHVIGAGGTGGYFLCFLARLLAGGNHVIHVYDGDRVEPKNLKRQNFTMDELDLNKAEAICNRLSNEILQAPKLIAHSEYLTCKEDLLAEILSSLEEDQSLILVLAVDNIATRKMVNELLMTDLVQERILTIALDSGNDMQGGQVVLYGNAAVSYKPLLEKSAQGMLPSMLQVYPELDKVKDENPGLVQNCADNAESEPQAMMANVRNGELLAHIVTRIFETHKAPGNLWRSDILTGNTRCMFTGFLEQLTTLEGN